jgi:hypothetical protein
MCRLGGTPCLGEIHTRPYLSVTLTHAAPDFGCHALADSGTDDCGFPSVFAGQIGLS